MDFYDPYEVVAIGDVKPGQLVQTEINGEIVLALAMQFPNGDIGYLTFEGKRAGSIQYPLAKTLRRFKEKVYIELPRRNASWNGYTKPAGPVVAAIDGEDLYLVFDHIVQPAAINVVTGVIEQPPSNPLYIKNWGIWSEKSDVPIFEI